MTITDKALTRLVRDAKPLVDVEVDALTRARDTLEDMSVELAAEVLRLRKENRRLKSTSNIASAESELRELGCSLVSFGKGVAHVDVRKPVNGAAGFFGETLVEAIGCLREHTKRAARKNGGR